MSDKEQCNTRETLLQRIRNRHDEESWEDFVYYYRQYIYIICRGMGVNHHDSEELVQKVMMKAWDKLPEFEYDKKKRFRGWLCMVTGNTVKDFFSLIKDARIVKKKPQILMFGIQTELLSLKLKSMQKKNGKIISVIWHSRI